MRSLIIMRLKCQPEMYCICYFFSFVLTGIGIQKKVTVMIIMKTVTFVTLYNRRFIRMARNHFPRPASAESPVPNLVLGLRC
jgi:hypothetical protein